jgi:putative ABC transport system permease protein
MRITRFVGASLRQRPLSTVLSALAVALGVALVVGIDAMRREARDQFRGAANPYDLVVGPKGSPLQITLNTVFHLGEATGTVPEAVWHELRGHPFVQRAVPYVVGDTWKGYRLVGTTGDIFGIEVRRGMTLTVAEGRPFDPFREDRGNWEVVAGARVAATTGLRVGDSITATHGLAEAPSAKAHDEAPWKVTGILAPTGTPLDRVLLIHYEGFHSMDGHDPTAGTGVATKKAPVEKDGDEAHDDHDDHEDDHADHADDEHADDHEDAHQDDDHSHGERRLSAVLLVLKRGTQPLLFGQLRSREEFTVAVPVLEVERLFEIVGNVDGVLLAVSVLVILVAALGILVSITNTLAERRRELALQRALGAPRRVVAGILLAEASMIGLLGGVGGLVLGLLVVRVASTWLGQWTGLAMDGSGFRPETLLFPAGALVLCAVAGLFPAWRAYRTDVAAGLAPNS